jgi:hypothetical protein
MKVGVFCSSNKPQLWGRLCDSLSRNSVDWNLCIAGPYSPTELLPGNVKHIQTNVKPAQCSFIAEQNTIGDYVINVVDDIVFSPGSLDNLIKMVDNKKTIASSKVFGFKIMDHYNLLDPRGYPADDPRSLSKDKNIRAKNIILNFPLPTGAMMYRETFDSIGIDKSFIALYWDFDIFFELLSRGGKIVLSETSTVSLAYSKGNPKSFMSRLRCDNLLLINMWLDGERFRNQRMKPINPLTYDADILNISQGKKKPDLSPEDFRLEKTILSWT